MRVDPLAIAPQGTASGDRDRDTRLRRLGAQQHRVRQDFYLGGGKVLAG
ncbi:Uncharacterised protein [Mycobacterium tuberculosis]|nr:Uncharacterised protein [Mycobacterium tuberculosis]